MLKTSSTIKILRRFASAATAQKSVVEQALARDKPSADELLRLSKLRNIGISAHIDSGKTTLTERILYYTGRISAIHDVKGKDGVGAKMDSMDLEREKGITIQSAATYARWNDNSLNIIDTPGHVDFTIEVERALRVLDGAILVLCSVGGVQSQTQTVDRQMRRYNVPRITFINKMDRMGANPYRVVDMMRKKLFHANGMMCALTQIPIGAEEAFAGVVDLVQMKAVYNDGSNGETLRIADIPDGLKEMAMEKRAELIASLAECDDEIADLFIEEVEPSVEQLKAAIRRATISLKFTPILLGSAFKNKSVQPLLNAVIDYLPNPAEKINKGVDIDRNESEVTLVPDKIQSMVSLAFKLEDTKFGQLTYMRVYQGVLKKGMQLVNTRTGKKVKLSKLVRMHSDEMEEVDELPAGEIGAIFGVECASGDSFTDGTLNWSMSSMFVPAPVVSYAIKPKKENPNFAKALNKFTKEDPTFRVHLDKESKETIISGMGELHLEIYVERLKREYGVDCVTGRPQVAYRETITQKVPFNYTHKKQSGGAGQFGRIIGYIEPLVDEEGESVQPAESSQQSETSGGKTSKLAANMTNVFEDVTVGLNMPSQYVPSVEKGFLEACEKGRLIGHPVSGIRFVLEDGAAHSVDSSDLAFRLAATGAMRQIYNEAGPQILEPIMSVSVSAPQEFQSNVMTHLNRRRGVINDSEVVDGYVNLSADVPLSQMFGYVTDLRSATQGKGEFQMEYKNHQPVTRQEQEELIKKFSEKTSKQN
ncbi:hypothetical protein MP228_010177 [Amoeboaphelidium protococcarum]|nr:hypothetical protein MP228_010177 [Amoeboaphelidium protococcarum]